MYLIRFFVTNVRLQMTNTLTVITSGIVLDLIYFTSTKYSKAQIIFVINLQQKKLLLTAAVGTESGSGLDRKILIN